MAKNYSATVNIKGFYYAVQKEDSKEAVSYDEPVHVPFAQSVAIETEQSIEKAYGDGVVAEMAVATGATTVTMGWHNIPLENRQELLGLEEEDGMIIQRSQVTPPDVAIILEQEKNDGSKELVGLTKGKFMLPAIEGETKEDSVEFGNHEIEGEFAARHYDDVAQIMVFIDDEDSEGKETKFKDKVFLDSKKDGGNSGGGDDGEDTP